MAILLVWASASWACAWWTTLPAATVNPNRAPAAADVTVSGTGWAPDAPISLALSTDGSTVLAPLGSATADATGQFTARVPLGSATAGVYYVSAVQGSDHTNIPLEVTALGRPLDSGRLSLATGATAPGFNDLSRRAPVGSAFPWSIALMAGGVLVLCGGVTAYEVRRQRAGV
ncbi:MAG: hypothetical protein ACRDU4_00445 [Mycobacterium sp.]